MVNRPLVVKQPAISAVTGTQLIDAIANLALAARAGALLKTYQREWSWMDKQNYIDAVDADAFNETFHGIEREFDKLADILTQSGGGLPAPDWDTGEVTLGYLLNQEVTHPAVLFRHELGTVNLRVDLKLKMPQTMVRTLIEQLKLPADVINSTADGGWTGMGADSLYSYVLPDPNHIILFRPDLLLQTHSSGISLAFAQLDITIRALIWKIQEG